MLWFGQGLFCQRALSSKNLRSLVRACTSKPPEIGTAQAGDVPSCATPGVAYVPGLLCSAAFAKLCEWFFWVDIVQTAAQSVIPQKCLEKV